MVEIKKLKGSGYFVKKALETILSSTTEEVYSCNLETHTKSISSDTKYYSGHSMDSLVMYNEEITFLRDELNSVDCGYVEAVEVHILNNTTDVYTDFNKYTNYDPESGADDVYIAYFNPNIEFIGASSYSTGYTIEPVLEDAKAYWGEECYDEDWGRYENCYFGYDDTFSKPYEGRIKINAFIKNGETVLASDEKIVKVKLEFNPTVTIDCDSTFEYYEGHTEMPLTVTWNDVYDCNNSFDFNVPQFSIGMDIETLKAQNPTLWDGCGDPEFGGEECDDTEIVGNANYFVFNREVTDSMGCRNRDMVRFKVDIDRFKEEYGVDLAYEGDVEMNFNWYGINGQEIHIEKTVHISPKKD